MSRFADGETPCGVIRLVLPLSWCAVERATRAGRRPDDSIRESGLPVRIKDLGLVDYRQTWADQVGAVARRAADHSEDELWLLSHPSVFTAGRQTKPGDRPMAGIPVVDVDRGGSITWHGPGQLVVYPIVKLGMPIDVVNYVRRIEEAVITVCHNLGLVDAGRVEGRTGIWLPPRGRQAERKIAAIGVRVSRRVTMHGVALNCNNTLLSFGQITPCGIDDAGVTSLSAELGHEVTPDQVKEALAGAIAACLDGKIRVTTHEVATLHYRRSSEGTQS